jgi:hypothetical protein
VEVLTFLKTSFSEMLARPNIREEIGSALLEEGRLEIVLQRMLECVNYRQE